MTIVALPEPLEKEIAYPGTFVDAYGNRVTLRPDDYSKALAGTRQLIDAGFKIRGFTSHFTDDSKDVVGTWHCLYLLPSGRLRGVFQPRTEEMRQLALGLDTSVVIEEDVQLPNGVVVPMAITRVDIVPQGAVVGTEPFAEFVRSRSAAVALSRRVLLAAACEEKSMKGSMMRALAAALGMDVAGELNEEAVEKAVIDSLGLADATDEEKDQALSRAFAKAFAQEGEGEDEASMSDEAPPAPESQEAPKSESAEMSALSKRIAKLEDDKVAALVAPLKTEEKKRVMSRFSALRSAAGFDMAFDVAADLVGAMTKSDPITTALSSAAGGSRGTAADTPRRTNQKPEDAKHEEVKTKLVAAMQRRLGTPAQAKA